MSQVLAAKQRFDDQRGDRLASQMKRAGGRSIENAIHPSEGLAIGDFAGRRKMRAGKAAMQMPGEEQPMVIGIDVGKAALGRHAMGSGGIRIKISRSHECERGTQECVRHRHGRVRHRHGRVRHRHGRVRHRQAFR
jgi:hypothetical protein